MHSEFGKCLKQLGRRILLVRVVESAALGGLVGAAVACAAFAASAAAWALGPGGSALCFLPAMILLVLTFSRHAKPIRRELRLSIPRAGWMSSLGAVLGVFGAWWMHSFYAAAWVEAFLLILLGALLGGVTQLLRRPGALSAAREADRRAQLPQQVTTAAELAGGDKTDPFADAVVADALRQLRSEQFRNVRFWNRGRGTAGALVLGVALAGLLAVVADASRPAEKLFVPDVAQMPAGQREELAKAFRKAADSNAENGPTGLLRQGAIAVEAGSEQELREIIAQLKAAGYSLTDFVPQAALAGSGMGTAAGKEDLTAPDSTPDGSPANEPSSDRIVRVWDPDYGSRPVGEPAQEQRFLNYEDAWKQAELRAARSGADPRVPAEVRPVVRKYFSP
ncbi:MAG: hypothetical protein ACLFVU_04635 [Phycisphaerae bacterium]